MLTQLRNDRLLFFTRLALTLLLGLAIFAGVALSLTIPIIFLKEGNLAAKIAANGLPVSSTPWVALMVALMAVIAALAFFFVRHLRRIVDSVSQGDPFVPINADRLRHMAWLALAMQAILIPLTGLIVWFDALPQRANVHYSDNNSFGGLILALLLFVLARVFRVGAAMRDELEGTV